MTKRLFIAVNISEEARKIAAELMADLRKEFKVQGVSWVKPENLHITVKFLGDTTESALPALIEKLTEISKETLSFNLQFSAPEILGKRVISIGVTSDNKAVFDLEKRIDTELALLGFKPEGRSFHPHLTLARIRDTRGKDGLIRHHRDTKTEPVKFDVREIVLYESELKPTGSVYSRLAVFPLLGV